MQETTAPRNRCTTDSQPGLLSGDGFGSRTGSWRTLRRARRTGLEPCTARSVSRRIR